MNEQKKSTQQHYLEELSRNLQRAGFEAAWVENEGKLLISREGVYLCRVSGEGTVFYKREIVDALDAQAELDRIVDIANDTGEYMTMLAYAPPLKAQGLTGDYRVLADFGGAVLAAHPTGQGVKFVTWAWDFDHKGVCYGHYHESEYRAAKRDFASRSGLISGNHLFSDAQLVEIYRCCADTIEGSYDVSETQRDIILGVQEQMSIDMPGLVQTSTNFGVLKLTENELTFSNTVRSAITAQKEWIVEKITSIVKLAGGETLTDGNYPGWAYNHRHVHRQTQGFPPHDPSVPAGEDRNQNCGIDTISLSCVALLRRVSCADRGVS